MKTKLRLSIISVALACAIPAAAAPVFSEAPTVTIVDREATFDSLNTEGIPLDTYSEGLLSVTVNDTSWVGFPAFAPGDPRTTGFHYGDGGNDEYVTIRGTDDATFFALDLLLGSGYGFGTNAVRWETYLNGNLTGSGVETSVPQGSIVGWSDAGGFDELRVAAGIFSPPGFGQEQAIAIDDLRVQLAPFSVPLPGSAALIGLGLAGLALSRRLRI